MVAFYNVSFKIYIPYFKVEDLPFCACKSKQDNRRNFRPEIIRMPYVSE